MKIIDITLLLVIYNDMDWITLRDYNITEKQLHDSVKRLVDNGLIEMRPGNLVHTVTDKGMHVIAGIKEVVKELV